MSKELRNIVPIAGLYIVLIVVGRKSGSLNFGGTMFGRFASVIIARSFSKVFAS